QAVVGGVPRNDSGLGRSACSERRHPDGLVPSSPRREGAGVSDRRVYLSTRRLPRGKCHRPEREGISQRHQQRFHSRFGSCARSSTSIIATLPSLPLARHRKGSSMANTSGRDFDLNIEKVLDSWTVSHAIRELIANALDEQALSHTRDVQIAR